MMCNLKEHAQKGTSSTCMYAFNTIRGSQGGCEKTGSDLMCATAAQSTHSCSSPPSFIPYTPLPHITFSVLAWQGLTMHTEHCHLLRQHFQTGKPFFVKPCSDSPIWDRIGLLVFTTGLELKKIDCSAHFAIFKS